MKTKVLRVLLSIVCVLTAAFMFGCDRTQKGLMPVITDTSTETALKVGILQPPNQFTSFTKGAELARDVINAAGGVNGMQLEFIYKDELTETVADTVTELVEVEDVVGIIGPVFSSDAVRVDPNVQIPMLAGATDANRVTQTNDFIFLVGGSNIIQGKLMAKFAIDELKASTAAMIWQDEDVYSKGLIDAFDAEFKALGGSTLAGVHAYQVGDTDFTEQLTAIKAADPDVLLLASFAPEVPRIMAAARAMDIEAVFIGGDGMDDPENMFGTLTDNTPLENTYYTTNLHRTSEDPSTKQFIEAYKTMFDEAPDGVAATGYDNVRLLAMAFETTQSIDPVIVRDAIAAIKNYKGATTISHFDAQRRAIKGVGIIKIENGQFMPHSFIHGVTTAE